ncbi:MAG: VOC family protein [Candidatus Binataceae bacterium]|jgi:catechol 2,3-dioxygenase-like lactoylglutathione lyase family enzyme
MTGTAKMRVARPTDNLDAVARFYTQGLGLAELYRFENHAGFDGVMLGTPDAPYHLEFTRAHGHRAGRAPTADNLLVFYLPDEREWNDAVARMKKSGYEPVASFNPYWDQDGLTFEDPDGYRVVLQHAAWER